MNQILYYFHDPMCSWCYAFRHSLAEIKDTLPKAVKLEKRVTGLAKDSDVPMDKNTQSYVMDNWRRIEQQVRDTQFNYDFWSENIPIRSTYPACRAVLSAKKQGRVFEDLMINQIQDGYYQQAKNPSLINVLIEFAGNIGLNTELFETDILSAEIEQQLKDEIHFSRRIGVQSFPSLVMYTGRRYEMLKIDYNQTQNTIKYIQQH